MRKVHELQRRPGAPDIRRIRPTVRSRDDIPAILIGLQDPCSDEGIRKRLSGFPGRMVPPGKNRRVGRPGMEPLTILVPARLQPTDRPEDGGSKGFRPARATPQSEGMDPTRAPRFLMQSVSRVRTVFPSRLHVSDRTTVPRVRYRRIQSRRG